MKRNLPGIGGSLGECVVCGDTFAFEILTGKNVRMIQMEAFGDNDLPVHEKCLVALEAIRGEPWESLPDGPVRKAFEEHAAKQACDGR